MLESATQAQQKRGFALIVSISLLAIILMVSLAFLTLSTSVTRHANYGNYEAIARANARMAMMVALGRLQDFLGADQRVSATAAILETPDDPGTSTDEGTYLPGRHWLGVWDTVYTDGDGKSWPVIGKKPDLGDPAGNISPYPYKGIYSDLRYSGSAGGLQSGGWKLDSGLRRGWLVSGYGNVDPSVILTDGVDGLEVVGRGTLGAGLSADEFAKRQVIVPRVSVERGGVESGSYGFYISDNNMKAAIAAQPYSSKSANSLSSVSLVDNPGAVLDSAGNAAYDSFISDGASEFPKVMTRETAALTGDSVGDVRGLRDSIRENFHDFTVFSPGLFTDPVLGGFKKDLTPLLFGAGSSKTVSFASPNAELASFPFASNYPIIPGNRRGTLGPSFDAMRHWGRQKYLRGLGAGAIDAQLTYGSAAGKRTMPSHGWPGGINDGVGFEGALWASDAPKIHPVLTESRWHYYFSHTENSGGYSLRSHMFPRVCLWNPYNVRMSMPKMIVMMANPLARYSNNFAFQIPETERLRITALPAFSGTDVAKWSQNSFTAQSSSRSGKQGLFPQTSWLTFEVEATTFEPGECLVFSPKVTSPDHSSGGVNIKRYNRGDISQNLLSATAPQGQDHFFHDYEIDDVRIKILDPTPDNPNRKRDIWPGVDFFKELDLSTVYQYDPWGYFVDGFVHALKAAHGPTTVSDIDVRQGGATDYPTVQLISNANSGASSYGFWYYTWWWGNSTSASSGLFGNLSDFVDTPQKDAPALHQFGTKLIYLDESATEANNPPIRIRRWGNDHVAYDPILVGNYNVRPNLVTRSTSCPVAREWHVNTNGAWMTSFAPLSPQDVNDMPVLSSSGKFAKHPMGLSLQFSNVSNTPMFELPDTEFGALSLASLRHAQLSPYSWHPTYIVGNSLADIHAPYEHSANVLLEPVYSSGLHARTENTFEYYLGGCQPFPLTWGARTWETETGSLLQLDDFKTSRLVNGVTIDSEDEIITYDIAFEVNQNLWDQYFLSGIPLTLTGTAYDWEPSKSESLWNDRYAFNYSSKQNDASMESLLNASGLTGLAYGFWKSGYFLKNNAAFNVNSTSVNAWVAFLSGLRDNVRAAQSGDIGGAAKTVVSRVRTPLGGHESSSNATTEQEGWDGARVLTDSELRTLAKYIVFEVKSRGPFLSMADFVNRRLAPKSSMVSTNGAVESAISKSGINSNLEETVFERSLNNASDNNHPDFQVDYEKQPASKTWGIPSHIIQSDILEPLAPAMTVRGDTFTIRCVGESVLNGRVMARAYLEVVVCRTPEYVSHSDVESIATPSGMNRPTDPALQLNRVTGEVTAGNLSAVNVRYGRKFKVHSMRWLNRNEI